MSPLGHDREPNTRRGLMGGDPTGWLSDRLARSSPRQTTRPARGAATRLLQAEDLARRARRRIPRFAWEYLDSGEGEETAVRRNREALQQVVMTPRFLRGRISPDVSVELFGVRYAQPLAIAPVGLTGLIWPGADEALADAAAKCSIPYVASTVNTADLSTVGPLASGMGWFQLYPPTDARVRDDLLERAERCGFTVLVVTADVPARSRRERQSRQRVSLPPRITPRHAFQAALKPAWTLELMRHGMPRFHTLEPYVNRSRMRDLAGFVGASLGGTLSWSYLQELRDRWSGPLAVKGVLHPDDAERCLDCGADAVIVSNHGGRQFDAAPASAQALGPIVERVGGRTPVLFDSGVRSGLDVARALALGADLALAGRAFMYGLGALGRAGPAHVAAMFRQQLVTVMHQLGCQQLSELRERDARHA